MPALYRPANLFSPGPSYKIKMRQKITTNQKIANALKVRMEIPAGTELDVREHDFEASEIQLSLSEPS